MARVRKSDLWQDVYDAVLKGREFSANDVGIDYDNNIICYCKDDKALDKAKAVAEKFGLKTSAVKERMITVKSEKKTSDDKKDDKKKSEDENKMYKVITLYLPKSSD